MRHLHRLFVTLLLISSAVSGEEGPPYAQMVPLEFMQPGFHRSVDDKQFPTAMQDAIADYQIHLNDNQSNADALFERRDYLSVNTYDGENSLPYEIMVPPPDAERPPGGFPLVFTTYGRVDIANVMALPEYREQYPAYVVSILNSERPGPLHAPPVYNDYAFLFLEFFDWLFDKYDIDTNRVYGAGWSRGGSSMSILSHAYASRHPDSQPLITAAVPSAGGFQNLLDNVVDSIRDVKFFSLQGANDGNSNPRGSEHAFDALEKAGALDNIFWWIEDRGHSPHNLGWKVREVVDWMFAQTKADLALRPTAALSVDITDADIPLSFNADATASTVNNGGSIASYTWQIMKSQEAIADYSERYLHGYTIDTGFQDAPIIGSAATLNHIINEPGTYWLRVIVEDNDGNRRAATQEIHARSIEPVADFTFSRNHEVAGRALQFDAAASLAEHQETITTYDWDFGDDHSAQGAEVAHSFASSGEYTVELTVTSSAGKTATHSQSVTISKRFPGYRYFRLVGLECDKTYRRPSIHHFALHAGSTEIPQQAMTSNTSQGLVLTTNYLDGWPSGDTDAWRAFDKDHSTSWTSHNYHTPVTLGIDVGEDQRMVPTAASIAMKSSSNRWVHFYLEGSVDQGTWDRLWTHRNSVDGSLDSDGSTVQFSDIPFIEISNIDNGGTYGLGTEFSLHSNTFNLENIASVTYYANDISIGSSTAGAPHELAWQPSELGTYELSAEANYGDGNSIVTAFPISITIDEAPELSRISVGPELVALYPGTSADFTAVAYSQFDNPLDPQPELTWSVSEDAGSIDGTGSWTAGSVFGKHTVMADGPEADPSTQGSVSVRVGNIDDPSIEYFAGNSLRDMWEFIAKEPWADASATVNHGTVTINSRGERMWEGDNFFSAIRRTDITGDFDISVQVVAQNDNYTDDGSKVGILVANNFDDLSQGGYVSFHTRGNRRILLQREGSNPGEISGGSSINFSDEQNWPVWLRLVKAGNEFTAYYKFSENAEWVSHGSTTVDTTAANSQVALFASANNTSETLSGIMTDFLVASNSLSRMIYIQRVGSEIWDIVEPDSHGGSADDGSLNPVPFGPLLVEDTHILQVVPSSGQ